MQAILLNQIEDLETLDAADRYLSNIKNAAAALANIGAKSNENLIINNDFRKSVNRNGKNEYVGTTYTIDRWKIKNGVVKVMDGYLEITLNTQYSSFSTTPIYSEIGKHYILSWLIDIISDGVIYTQIFTDKIIGYNYTSVQGLKVFSGHGNINSNITSVSLVNQETTPVTFKLYAVKLELGEQQTFAYTDKNDNLVLNDPLNYNLQYALCSQYNPITGEFIGSQYSNENLLINHYFMDPINQRSITEAMLERGYCIDCWFLQRRGCIKILDDKSVIFWSDATDYSSLLQKIEYLELGKIYTLSVLLDNNQFLTTTNVLTDNPNTGIIIGLNGDLFRAYNNIVEIIIRNTNHSSAETAIKIKAIKLELGSVQTLAHQDTNGNWILNDPPPNKTLELAKCQRYQRLLNSYLYYSGWVNQGGTVLHLDCNVLGLRAIPTVTILTSPVPDIGVDGNGQRIALIHTQDYIFKIWNNHLELELTSQGQSKLTALRSQTVGVWTSEPIRVLLDANL